MLVTSRIIFHQLSYHLPNGNILFNSLDFAFHLGKIGLIGKNGIGKSTLLKLIAGELLPNQGSIEIIGKVSYLPQNFDFDSNAIVADILGIKNKLQALERILQGSEDAQDFIILNDDWTIKDRSHNYLSTFNLAHINLFRPVTTLSGGEKTRLLLAKLFIQESDILLLDEPTNNLDTSTRKLLYQALKTSNALQLIVSHDRDLLLNMDEIIELTSIGIFRYGGNYEHYQEQKFFEESAKQQQLDDAKKSLMKTKQSIQGSHEKHEQRQAKGIAMRKAGKIDKLSANAAKGRSERSQKRLAIQKEQMLEAAYHQWQTAKEQIEISEEIKINLPKTYIPAGKFILKMENLTFDYFDGLKKPLINNFNLTIHGPKKIALIGNNGSGKTTLVKLILGKLKSINGKIQIGAERVSYLDQNMTILLPQLTLLENFLRLNLDMNEQEAHHCLAQFLFKNTQALKRVENLSGGEKLRAALACILMSAHPPQLLILDEPTNHLDLKSIASLESALSCYQGALIVISHDQTFLKNIGIQQFIKAPYDYASKLDI